MVNAGCVTTCSACNSTVHIRIRYAGMRYIHWHIPSVHYVVTHTYKHMMILCLCDIFHFKQGRVGRDTKRFDLVVCSSRPVRCTRPHVGVIHMYMMSATCSPEKNPNAMEPLCCAWKLRELSNWISPLSAEEEKQLCIRPTAHSFCIFYFILLF